MRQVRFQISTANAVDVELCALQIAHQRMLGFVEEVEAHDAVLVDFIGRGQLSEAMRAGREVFKRGEAFEMAAFVAQDNLAQINEVVPQGGASVIDRLLDGSQLPGDVTIPVFHLAVVLKEGNIVGRGFNQQHTAERFAHFDRVIALPTLDSGALYASRLRTRYLLRQLQRHLLAPKMHGFRGLNRGNRLPRKGFVERLGDCFRAEGQIGRSLDLHQTPVVAPTKDVEARAVLPGVAIKNPVQRVRRGAVGQLLRAIPV